MGKNRTYTKKETQNNVFEHSQAKLNFYREYLKKYFSVLGHSGYFPKINIYDIFCGEGIYKDKNEGSPIIARQIIDKVLLKFPTQKISLTINDEKTDKVNFVEKHIQDNYTSGCEFNSFNLDAKEMLQIVIDKIQRANQKERNLVFIDPYGYKDIYKKDIEQLLSRNNTEVIIFLPINQMYRFTIKALEENQKDTYASLVRFVNDFFDDTHPIKTTTNFEQKEYINYIRDAFSFGKYFVTSYNIEKSTNAYYGLFYISHNIKGLEKAVETKWELDRISGEGFEQKKPNLFYEEFSKDRHENRLNEFKKDLVRFLEEEKTNNDIYYFTLKSSFLPKYTNNLLKQLDKDGSLVFDIEKPRGYYLAYMYYKNNDIKYKVKMKT